MNIRSHIDNYLAEVQKIAGMIDKGSIENLINIIVKTKEKKGRLFILGVGGSAANASHAVNDFRKIAGLEAYAPTDNVSELTARVNDDGWDSVFTNWLETSNLNSDDCVFIFSVGGGNREKNISNNLVEALKYAKKTGSKIIGIVGRDGGYTSKAADAFILIPTVNPETLTPHAESFQSVILHMIISHPALKEYEMKWESVK